MTTVTLFEFQHNRPQTWRPNALRKFAYHRAQSAFYHSTIRFNAVPSGRRAGKTELARRRMLRRFLVLGPSIDGGPRAYGVGCPTRQQAKAIYWPWFKRFVPRGYQKDVSDGQLVITLVDGAELCLVSMDEPARIEGRPWDGFLVDEVADTKADFWDEHLRLALADRNGWADLLGVPEGRNHWWLLCQRAQAPENALEWAYHHWTAEDVWPLYGRAAEVASAKREMDPRTYRQEMLGSFEEAAGRIYYGFDRTRDVHEFPFDDRVGTTEERPWYGGMDFNVDPMTACWGWERDEPGPEGMETHVYVWDELSIPNADTDVAARAIRERCEQGLSSERTLYPYAGHTFGHFEMHPDPTGKARKTSAAAGRTDHTILKSLGFRVRTREGSPPRRDKYNSVNSMLCNGVGRRRIHIHPRCRELPRCLEGLLYKEGTSEPDLVKSAGMDHITDSLAYWIEKRHRLGSLGEMETVKF